MPADLAVIKGPYFRDLLDQPRAIAATAEALEMTPALSDAVSRVRAGKFRRLVLTGMGSSYHALHPLHIRLIDAGFNSVMEETSELIHYKARLLDEESLVIVVSQSGRSAEIVHLLNVAARRATLLGVTNTPGSPLDSTGVTAVLTKAGDESSVSCKTYMATLAALSWLADLLVGHDPDKCRAEFAQAARAAAQYLDDWERHVTHLLALLDVRHIFIAGRGPSLAAVNTGALIIKESDHFPAEGMSSAAFRHGPFEMLSRDVLVVVFAGPPNTTELNSALVRDIANHGGRAALVSEDADSVPFRIPTAPAAALPAMEILPVQMLTLALGAKAGRTPGTFTLASKVTTVE
jgi:glucosamine--fructose-6-phosphate aminotransferase (isomerizing)